MLGEEEEAEDPCKRQWLNNYELNEVDVFSLFNEYLEIGTWGRSLAGERWMQGRPYTGKEPQLHTQPRSESPGTPRSFPKRRASNCASLWACLRPPLLPGPWL